MPSTGLDPTLAATLPLVGVALGAVLGGIARATLDRRAERRAEAAAMRAAARIVYDDLWRMREVLTNASIDTLDDEHRRARLTAAGWEQTRTTLARDYHAWNAARDAVLHVEAVQDAYRASKRGPAGITGFYVLLDGALEKLDDAMHAMEPLGAGVVERRVWRWWPRRPARVL